jgi:hypothetical protein
MESFYLNTSMKIRDILFEGRDAPIYHGVDQIRYAISALDQNFLLGKTSHGKWISGLRYPSYELSANSGESKYGISTTRDLLFALKWGEVVFELDQNKISQKYPIIPMNYFYSNKSYKHSANNRLSKEEREEFIVTGKNGQGGIPLSPYLKKIYLDAWLIAEGYGDDPDGNEQEYIAQIQHHPLYAGLYERRNGIVRLLR